MTAKPLDLAGWGRTGRARVAAYRPERRLEAAEIAAGASAHSILARGAGRSYGDAAVNGGGAALLTERLDRILADDGEVVACEPGVTFRTLLEVLLPRGRMVPVSPGTAFATVGGAVACDVHGKNHDVAGSFGDHVEWIDLALASGETVRVSPREDPGLFAAAVGGLGLAGVILAVAFRTVRVPSDAMEVRETRHGDLDAFMAALAEARRSDHAVGWIDAVARGATLGRGVLQTARFAPAGAPPMPASERRIRMPFDLPGFALNRRTVGLFNELYFRRVPAGGRERRMPAAAFLYPLDAILDWNRMYGRAGFHQFQCVVPDAQAGRGIPALMEAVSASGAGSFLAVLKTLGAGGRGHLSFPMPGFTLALDVPAGGAAEELLPRLERITLDHGGRIYLAKDSRLSPEGFRRMHPRLPEFRAVLERVDPHARFQSDLSRRLCIREQT